MGAKTKTIKVASALILDEDGKMLLLKRNELSYHGFWQFPEGKLENGEDPKKALIRELKEEIGADTKIISKVGEFKLTFNLRLIKIDALRHVYLVKKPKEIILSEEHTDYVWANKKEALKLKLVPGVRNVIHSQYFKG